MTKVNELTFEPRPRESAKAHAAFRAYLDLGPQRSLARVAADLGKSKVLMERWSRRFDWSGRVAAHTQHLATVERQAAEALASANGEAWARRRTEHQEAEWQMRTELITAGRKVLAKFMDGSRGATLGDVARALELASKLGRLASGLPNEVKEAPPEADRSVLIAIELALDRVYGPATPTVDVEEVGKAEPGKPLLEIGAVAAQGAGSCPPPAGRQP